MTIECTPRELAELLRNLQNGGPVWKAVDLPPAKREELKPYMGRHEKSSGMKSSRPCLKNKTCTTI